ncbi:MAG TPA: NADH-quinone oxidoreductase subunit N [Syntrophorhabdaceae bacterium]|nr:NADH-quinone oxidoreductase subunit N [Syntrophorhabdaceae bacterium]HOL05306.1 NADH-quinone oxidoreductase subunit N [Syntrophorhabdaceae bacterium]HON85745.1 NADH-quinone oxidoreductase subunit N [Syntrophorhabdaceae bacterium]HPC66048.1 NADH-quinone oxidoreductase subunit N [Syntrophorhabdaceae bacterium]HPP41773.1 NADH-quinone oxidoreductase subunit N [Syntrophorhabdaceae bacterium]
MLILPELYLILFSIIFLFISLGKSRQNVIITAKVLSFIAFFISVLCLTQRGELFYSAYRIDLYSQIFKILIALGLCLVVFMFSDKDGIETEHLPEYFMFLSLSSLGLMMLSSSVELISIIISLEISSYSLYVIVPLRRSQDSNQIEAAMKYLFFGAISTGIMLFGIGYLYSITGSTFIAEIFPQFRALMGQTFGVFALILTLTGIFFKLSLFPMHFWAPDIYEGASNVTTTFIATLPKIAATALLIRLATIATPIHFNFVNALIILSALSMTFGNFVGLVQRDLKRLLAYSGIAHAGYLMMGILTLNADGIASAIYYITIYVFMTLACFYVIITISRQGENATLDDLTGLSKRSPLLAMTLAVAAFSLAGIPPTGGFTGKFFLFTNAFKQGYLPIVIIGAVNAVISIFYYLNLVRMSYSKDTTSFEVMKLSAHEKIICYVLIFIIIYMGVLPFGLMNIFKFSLLF